MTSSESLSRPRIRPSRNGVHHMTTGYAPVSRVACSMVQKGSARDGATKIKVVEVCCCKNNHNTGPTTRVVVARVDSNQVGARKSCSPHKNNTPKYDTITLMS